MGDVSNASEQVNVDLQAIMNGGAHFLDRMTAFMAAKEQAAAILAQANADAQRRAEESERDRVQALKDIDAARAQAAQILQDANDHAAAVKAGADQALADAQKRAADIIAQANVDAIARMDEANALMREAAGAQSALDQRAAELASKERAAEQATASAEAALAEATATQQKHQGMIARLKAAMAED